MRWLVLDRPDVGNSVTRAMQRDIIDNLVAGVGDSEIRAVVLTAARQQALLHRTEPA